MRLSTVLHSSFLVLVTYPFRAAANGQDEPGSTIDGDVSYWAGRVVAEVVLGKGDTQRRVNVTLDTGSTDMWVNPVGGVQDAVSTGVSKTIHYGGNSSITGTISTVDVTILGNFIQDQAFINVNKTGITKNLDTCASEGLCGLIGLGFDSTKQGIEGSLLAAGRDPSIGRSVLSRIFDANPTHGRFFAMSISRPADPTDSHAASLAISEYDPKYNAVPNMPKLPVWPPGGLNWEILGNGLGVDGHTFSYAANNKSVPAGHQVVWMDSGTPNMAVRKAVRDQIYGAVPGAALAQNTSLRNPRGSSDGDVWVVPCSTAVNFSATFGSMVYPVHPLDLSDMHTVKGPDGKSYTACIGSISNGVLAGNTDALFGDTFLRNVYAVYSFGDNSTAPFMQMLPLTEQEDAAADFALVRGQSLAQSTKSAPELAPADLIRLFDGRDPVIIGSAPGLSSGGGADDSGACTASTTSNLKSAAALSDSGADSTSTLDHYAPAILGLLGANLLVLLALLGFAVASFTRGSGRGGRMGGSGPRYVPARTHEKVELARESFESSPYSDRETQ